MSRKPTNVITDRDPGDEHSAGVPETTHTNRDPGDECDAAEKRAASTVAFFVKPKKTAVITGRDPGDESTADSAQHHDDGHGDVHRPRRISKL